MRKLATLTIALLSLNFLTACGFEIVDTGRRGLMIKFGEVASDPLPEGIYFYNPFTTDVIELNVQEQKIEGETDAFTRDTQNVKIKYALTYYPDASKIGSLYKQFGYDWEDKVINQIVLGSMKDAVGQYNADDLVSKREVAKATAQKEIHDALIERSVNVTDLQFTNLDFDDAYEKAVEEKVVAIQEAQKAKNETVRVQEQSNQKVIDAKAVAEAMRIKTEALKQSKALVDFEAVQKWNGVLPQYIFGGGAVPFIDVAKIGKGSRTE